MGWSTYQPMPRPIRTDRTIPFRAVQQSLISRNIFIDAQTWY